MLFTCGLLWSAHTGRLPQEPRTPAQLSATTLATGASQDITIHIGIPSAQQGGLLSLLVMVVNRSQTPVEDIVVSHRMPAGLQFLQEQSDERCMQVDGEILCSLAGEGNGFSLHGSQSITFDLVFRVEECVTPSQHSTSVRRVGGEEYTRRSTNIAFSCEEMMKPDPAASSSRASSLPASLPASLPSSSSVRSSLRSAASSRVASQPQASQEEPCVSFCTTRDGAPACKLICASLDTQPSLPDYFCNGRKVASFRCTVFPPTERDGAFPRSTCEYECN
jgi:hypothetical protein